MTSTGTIFFQLSLSSTSRRCDVTGNFRITFFSFGDKAKIIKADKNFSKCFLVVGVKIGDSKISGKTYSSIVWSFDLAVPWQSFS